MHESRGRKDAVGEIRNDAASDSLDRAADVQVDGEAFHRHSRVRPCYQ